MWVHRLCFFVWVYFESLSGVIIGVYIFYECPLENE